MQQKLILPFFCLVFSAITNAQTAPVTDTAFKPSGKVWGLAFGDYYYKKHSDALNRGGANQYTNIEAGRNAFQFRRIYLGYNYEISKKFSSEFILAAEDNVVNASGVTTGDLLGDNRLAFYIKVANLRWKNIWKGTDLVIGQTATPVAAFGSDAAWTYRSIERTIVDIRRTPYYDFGATLQGKFDPETGNFGYYLMVANGTAASPENNRFKWFYGDVYAKLFNKKVYIDFYADYNRINWSSSYHHYRNMLKGFVSYSVPKFTVGVEAFINNGHNDVVGVKPSANDTLSAMAKGISIFARGILVNGKLNYFLRMDRYDPDTKYNHNLYSTYKGLTTTYEPNNKEEFIVAGLDFTPMKNVHFMPNVWYNRYTSEGSAPRDYDLVYRITFFYVYGR